MNKASEKMVKRPVILADGRYMVFYTFATPHAGDSSTDDADVIADSESSDEEN